MEYGEVSEDARGGLAIPLSCLKPDVACVQEALSSADRLAEASGAITWSETKAGGTGVFVRRGLAAARTRTPTSLLGSYVAAVELSLGSSALRVFSVHVGPESWKNQEAFEPWLVRDVQVGQSLVGGDINTSREYSAKHKAYLNRLIESGVHDCHWAKQKREVPSFWGRQSQKPKYQDDHFFASRSLAGAVQDCWVDDNPRTRILSDHGPVVLDLATEPTDHGW